MKNLTQLPGSGKDSKAKNDNTLGRMRGGIRYRIGSMSLKNTSLFGVILTLLLTFGVGEMWGYTLYLYTGSFSDNGNTWETSSASFVVYTNTDICMTSLGNHWYSADIGTFSGTAYIKRCASNCGSKWNEFSGTVGSADKYFKVTGWNSGTTLTTYAITVSAGSGGSVNRSVRAGSGVPSWTFTATPSANYAFTGWTKNNSKATIADASAATTYVTTASGACTVTANFAPQWNIKGSMSNDDWSTFYALDYVSSNTFRGTITLAANTTYEFKVVDRKNNGWYGYDDTNDGTVSFVGQTTASPALSNASGKKNLRIMTAGAGTYTFEWNSSSKTLTVTYPTVTHPSSDYIYYKNTKGWTNVYSYVYGATTNVWAGTKMSSFTFDGVTYYYTALGDNTSIVFNQGNGTNQDDLSNITDNKRKYYDPSSSSWKDFKVTVTLNNHDATTAGTESVSPVYETEVLSNITVPAKTGYTFGGYYTAEGGSGSQLINASGVWQTVATYTDASKHWIKNTSVTLHAKWTENKYTVTINNDGGGSTSPSGAQSNIGQVTGVAISTTPNDGKEFSSWEIVSGTGSFESSTGTSSNKFFPTSTATIRANFRSNRALTVAAGTHVTTVTGSVDPVTLGTPTAIAATAFETGYEFDEWTASPAVNASFANSKSASTNVTVLNGSVTVTANAKQKMSTLTTSCHYDAGTPGYAVPTKSVSSIGIATTSNLSATAAGTGYTFVGWTLTHCVRTDSNGETSRSITVRSDGSGEAATAVANYEEDLSTPYIVTGGNMIVTTGTTWRTTADDDNKMFKASGHSTESVAYFTVPVTATNTGSSNANYKFKIYNTSTSTYYGLEASGQYWVLRENDNGVARTLGDYADIELRADVTGDYLLKVNYSSTPTLTVYFPLAVTWTAASIYSGNAATIAATVNDIEASKSIKFDVYAGSTATGDVIATWSGTTSSTSHTQNLSVTPSFGASETSKQYTVKVTYDGSQTATYTSYVYRKWDIYVQNNCSWASGIYYYGFGNGTNAEWPGTACSVYDGIWYTVTLDGRYPTCVLNNNNNKEQTNDVTVDIEDYEPETFWDFKYTHEYEGTKYYDLESVTLSDPTVELTTYEVISTTQIYVKGTITNFGNDGTAASDMKEVGFKVGETEYTTTCTDGSTFERYITGLTANTSYSVKAYATNLHGTGESSATAHTTRATGNYTIKVRTGVSDPVPYIRAFVYSDESCGGTGLTENASGNGVAMTLAITATTYKWYTYSLSNEYQKFYINENASNTETWDQTAPLEETCYWYHHGAAKNDRFGSMTCPYTDPQLMINTPAASSTFTYYEMSGSTTVSKTMSLLANSTYAFKVVYQSEHYGKSEATVERTGSTTSNSISDLTVEGMGDNIEIHTDFAGDYTFNFNTSTKAITVTYPTAYTVTFGMGTGGATISASATTSGSISSRDYVKAGDDVTFTQSASSGYTFAGWYDASTGGSAVATMGVSDNVLNSIGANATVYSRYTPNNYTVSFNVNGGTASTPDNKSVTFASAYGELPGGMTHASKTFVGWFTDPDDGEGDLITAETIVSTASDHILYAHYENVYRVDVQFKCGSDVLYPATSVNASATSLTPTISAPEIFGYEFSGWTETTTSYVTFTPDDEATTTITTTGAATVVANYTAIPTVYFKNNLGWENVYVSFDCGWVTVGDKRVPSNKTKPYYKMTQIGSSDVYYCAIPEQYTSSNYASWAWNIAFDNTNYGGHAEDTHIGTWDFYGGECVGRGDFDPQATMYIPYKEDFDTRNTAKFYSTGCWMKYNSTESGYKIYANTYVSGSGGSAVAGTPVILKADIAGGFEFKAKVNFPTANYKYGFMLKKEYSKNNTDVWYTNTSEIHANTTTLPWEFTSEGASENGTRCAIQTESVGDYEFTVSFATGKPMVDVEYPVSTGDWKLIYKDRATWSNGAHSASWAHPSRVIKAKADAEDIISFYVAYGSTPSVELHKCTAINALTGAETWEKQSNVTISSITETGVYNFKVTQNADKEATVTVDGGYNGNFYIRTDVSDGGWTNYKTSGTNTMTYSEYAETNHDFTHYFMRYVNTGSNIKFCIANDYNECISDTLVGDSFTGEYIAAYGNVRFMWDHRTNRVSRAYISGSSNISDRFLVLVGDAKMFNEAGTPLTTGNGRVAGLNEYEMNFTDDQNWIYEATVKARPGAKVKLTARYNNKIQYFYGDEGTTAADSVLLLGGNEASENKYKIRVVYDFKTNRMIKAFIPDGAIGENLSIEADLMIIREHQGEAQQITFSGSGKLSDVKAVYGAMKFNKYTVNGKEKTGTHPATGASRYERDLFYISFPFDVKLSDAFGFGTYGKHWIIEYYDGKERAEKGFWAETETFWKFVMPSQRSSFTMKANEGYILALDLDEMTESSSIWNNGVEDVYVYFPSTGDIDNIYATEKTVTIDQTGYECTINRATPDGDRRVKDSYWHMIGAPSFANYGSVLKDGKGGTTIDWSDDDGEIDWTTPSLPYLYEWTDKVNNNLSVTSSATFSFKAMHSYMVQYAGTSIYWSEVNAVVPTLVAPRKMDNAPKDIEFRLELQQDEQKADQAFIKLSYDEHVTTGFDFNYDLSKEMNGGKANIYTMITSVIDNEASVTEAAGNVLPMTEQTTVVPVGVKIATNGDYTFSIPEGTEGVGVTLIDTETGIRTSLSALDYTVSLEAGTYNDRFVIEISPIQHVATELETSDIRHQKSDVRKILIDGLLYIVRDGKMFDARGARVE